MAWHGAAPIVVEQVNGEGGRKKEKTGGKDTGSETPHRSMRDISHHFPFRRSEL